MKDENDFKDWILLGDRDLLTKELESQGFLKELTFGDHKIVLSYYDGEFGALNNRCNHMGAPLSKGKLKKGCIECPWHYWQFNHKTGDALSASTEPLSSHGGTIPSYPLKIENNNLYINLSRPLKE